MENLWIILSIVACFLTALKVNLFNVISLLKKNSLLIVSLFYLCAGLFGLFFFMLTNKSQININYDFKTIILILFTGFILLITTTLVIYTLKITPNLAYTHSIINLNIIITIILSYLVFNQKLNKFTLFGMLLSLLGIIIVIFNYKK
jgi:drug/metabolite transporter (DMT)-like permease